MHPAFSVIFLTTLIGMGQGLFLALITAQFFGMVQMVPNTASSEFYAIGALIVLVLLGAGLLASFFHLGHPERAWRSAARWKTSWLSREVIALPAFMAAVFVYGMIQWMGWDVVLINATPELAITLSFVVGIAAAVLSFTLFICTGMIYACIRFLQEWATPLTVINFIMFGLASGFSLAAVYAHSQAPGLVNLFAGWAIVFTVIAAITRISSLIRNARIKPKSTHKTAIGVRHQKIRQISQGAMGGSFNTREYMHHQPEVVVKFIKWFFLIAVFIVPLVFLSLGLMQNAFIAFLLAVVVQYIGLLAERWFFFAQSNHPQNIYYQAA